MSQEKTPMTAVGYKSLKDELHKLKTIDRIEVSRAIEVARGHGDLSENADYDAAKQSQGLIEAKIRDLESKVSSAQVVDISKLSGSKVIFGATIKLLDLDKDTEMVVSIVGEDESDIGKGKISFKSPLARSVIGKECGDIIEAKLPGGQKSYEIMEVIFLAQE